MSTIEKSVPSKISEKIVNEIGATNVQKQKTDNQSIDVNILNATNSNNKRYFIFSHLKYEYLLAGVAGGAVSTLTLHPLDLIKIRFAVNDGHTQSIPQYSGSINAFRKIVKTEGYTGLYRGITPNVLGSATAWGSYFLIYNCIKNWIQNGNTTESLGPLMHMVAAAEAGVLTLTITNPIWVVKTRLCLQYREDVNLSETRRYSGMLDALKKISSTEGIAGLYKGFVPGLIGVSHGSIQFMVYEEMKLKYNLYKSKPITAKLDTTEYIVCAAVSKLIAAAVTYPYQVLRARLQDHHHNYQGTLHCIKSIWRYEGWQGYYKGLSVNLLRVTPATVITFVVYENVLNYLLHFKEK